MAEPEEEPEDEFEDAELDGEDAGAGAVVSDLAADSLLAGVFFWLTTWFVLNFFGWARQVCLAWLGSFNLFE